MKEYKNTKIPYRWQYNHRKLPIYYTTIIFTYKVLYLINDEFDSYNVNYKKVCELIKNGYLSIKLKT